MDAQLKLWPQVLLSALFVGCYFGFVALIVTGQVHLDEMLRDMLLMLVGILTREIPTIMQYWFGSSIGSKTKEAQAAAMPPGGTP